jgi:hypothetical protein
MTGVIIFCSICMVGVAFMVYALVATQQDLSNGNRRVRDDRQIRRAA